MARPVSGAVIFEHQGAGGHGITSPDRMMFKFDPDMPGDRKFSVAVRSANSLKAEVVLLTEGEVLDFAMAVAGGIANILRATVPDELAGFDIVEELTTVAEQTPSPANLLMTAAAKEIRHLRAKTAPRSPSGLDGLRPHTVAHDAPLGPVSFLSKKDLCGNE